MGYPIYVFELEIKIPKADKSNNDKVSSRILRVNNLKTNCYSPLIKLVDNKLRIYSNVNNGILRYVQRKDIKFNVWTTLRVQQTQQKSKKYMYSIDINGINVYSIINKKPRMCTTDMQVYAHRYTSDITPAHIR